MRMLRTTLAAAFVALAGVAPGYAEVVGVVVRFDDLDLSNPRDAHTMVQRIDNAADRACGGDPGSRIYDGRIARARAIDEFEACRDAAVGDALTQLGSVEVIAAYRAWGTARLA